MITKKEIIKILWDESGEDPFDGIMLMEHNFAKVANIIIKKIKENQKPNIQHVCNHGDLSSLSEMKSNW